MNKLTILLNQIKNTRNVAFDKYLKAIGTDFESAFKDIKNKLDDLRELGEDLNKLDD